MSKQAHRLYDIDTGHDCHPGWWPSREIVTSSPTVKMNIKGLTRVGDTYKKHCCGTKCHIGHLATGNPTVLINGKPAGRVSDTVDCGGQAKTGALNVFI